MKIGKKQWSFFELKLQQHRVEEGRSDRVQELGRHPPLLSVPTAGDWFSSRVSRKIKVAAGVGSAAEKPTRAGAMPRSEFPSEFQILRWPCSSRLRQRGCQPATSTVLQWATECIFSCLKFSRISVIDAVSDGFRTEERSSFVISIAQTPPTPPCSRGMEGDRDRYNHIKRK